MDLSLTEEQELLRNTARDFMQRECSKEALLEFDESEMGCSEDVWQKASEIGWLGMLVPEQYGGAGSSLTDAAVVYEQLGAGPSDRSVLLVGSAWRPDRRRGRDR